MENIQVVSIEGNIGSGKSTFLKQLEAHFLNKGHSHVVFVDEPVDEWNDIHDKKGETILEKFYKDSEKYSFSFQMMAFITRYNKIQELIDEILEKSKNKNKDVFGKMEKSIIITERCLYTDKYVFAKMLYADKKIDEVNYQIYNCWFDTFAKKMPIDKVIYVNTPYTICDERIKKRNRKGESSIPTDYLKQCEDYHTQMLQLMILKKTTYIPINGSEDVNDKSVFKRWLDIIKPSLVNNEYEM